MPARTFGRIVVPDDRDARYPLRSMLPRTKSRRLYRYWDDDEWFGDQGDLPHCVGYAWAGWLESSPADPGGPPPAVDPDQLYVLAQQLDEYPGEAYDGTSVRGGGQAMRRLSYCRGYYWARTIADVVEALLERGPLVVGTEWWTAMSEPSARGLITPRGELEGGHAYLITGVHRGRQELRVKNSWGRTWGQAGRATISFADFALLLTRQGEACLPVPAV